MIVEMTTISMKDEKYTRFAAKRMADWFTRVPKHRT
jgi:hypothetical protein